jgi:signal transduction histidine kinase
MTSVINSVLRSKAESIVASRPAAPLAAPDALDALKSLHELQVQMVELELQNEELQRALEELEAGRSVQAELEALVRDLRARQALLEDENLHRSLFENLLSGFTYCRLLVAEGEPRDFVFLAVNASFEVKSGLRDLVGRKGSEVLPGLRELDPQLFDIFCQVALTGRPQRCELFVSSLQKRFSISVYSPSDGHFVALFDQSTGRKQAETYREMGREVLQVLNEPGSLGESVRHVISVLKERTGCDAVGIRLQDGDDYPYFGQEGFPEAFLCTENALTEPARGRAQRGNEDGGLPLPCTCGIVLSGRTDAAHPLFTPGGSFWTNEGGPRFGLPPAGDLRHQPRDQCAQHGYASMVLVPIRNKERIVGLVQFNDRRKGCFTLESVELLEGIASHIGSALVRKQAEMEKVKLEEQLQHAQKMESVGRLAGGVAHDFNNMLSVIIGHGNLALMQVAPGDALQVNLEEILKAAERSADLTRQLLAFARKQTIAPKILNLNEIVAGILKMLQRLIGERIELVCRHEEGLWPVRVDRSQIDQILANLCVNASDSIAGPGRIVIETRNSVVDACYIVSDADFVPGEYVRLSVGDNGCGMSRETQSRIFEPFYTTKDLGAGTGLGLATVYGIVKQNHGFINVYSEPGQGTTLDIYLPRHRGLLDPAHPEAETGPHPRGQETILLVEDEPTILNVATLILRKLGYTVLEASNPEKAIGLARKHADEIHLLLTDVVMPEMNGLELARNLQALYPHIKHLFMSGYTADIIAHNGVLDQGLQFIHKPFSLPDLAVKVREVLDAGPGAL